MLNYNGVQALLALRNDVRSASEHYHSLWAIARTWSPERDCKQEVQRVGRDLEKLQADLVALMRDMAADRAM